MFVELTSKMVVNTDHIYGVDIDGKIITVRYSSGNTTTISHDSEDDAGEAFDKFSRSLVEHA